MQENYFVELAFSIRNDKWRFLRIRLHIWTYTCMTCPLMQTEHGFLFFRWWKIISWRRFQTKKRKGAMIQNKKTNKNAALDELINWHWINFYDKRLHLPRYIQKEMENFAFSLSKVPRTITSQKLADKVTLLVIRVINWHVSLGSALLTVFQLYGYNFSFILALS